jgi:prophage antirepressor-like protein
MKNKNIVPFNFGDNLVRVLTNDNGEPLWVAKDICNILGYKEVSKTLAKLDDDEMGTKYIRTLGGNQ